MTHSSNTDERNLPKITPKPTKERFSFKLETFFDENRLHETTLATVIEDPKIHKGCLWSISIKVIATELILRKSNWLRLRF